MREMRRQGRRQSTEAKKESVCGKENAKMKARRRMHRSEVRGRRWKKRRVLTEKDNLMLCSYFLCPDITLLSSYIHHKLMS